LKGRELGLKERKRSFRGGSRIIQAHQEYKIGKWPRGRADDSKEVYTKAPGRGGIGGQCKSSLLSR